MVDGRAKVSRFEEVGPKLTFGATTNGKEQQDNPKCRTVRRFRIFNRSHLGADTGKISRCGVDQGRQELPVEEANVTSHHDNSRSRV